MKSTFAPSACAWLACSGFGAIRTGKGVVLWSLWTDELSIWAPAGGRDWR